MATQKLVLVVITRTALAAVAVLLAYAFIPARTAHAYSVTAFKIGETTSGMTKQCIYSFGSNQYTRTLPSTAICPLSIQVPVAPTLAPRAPISPPSFGQITAFKSGERTTGMTKQCYYTYGVNEYTKTISSAELCPLQITVRQ